MLKTRFEKETCGRCGGSGRYSYNSMHGSVCYGCGGHGERLTKRGSAASAFYVASCKVRFADVVVGDVLSFSGVTLNGTPYSRKAAVVRREDTTQKFGREVEGVIVWDELPMIGVWNAKNEGEIGRPETLIRKYWPTEINDAKIAAALAYQATLNKLGKLPKRAAKAEA